MIKKQISDKSGKKGTTKLTSVKSLKKNISTDNLSKRSGGRMLGALVPSLTKMAFKRKSPLFIQLIMDWENIVGSHIAQQSEPSRLRPGVLTIRCSGPIAMEIQYTIPRLLEQINTACGLYGEAAIQQVKLVQDLKKVIPQPRKKGKSPVLNYSLDMEEGPLREALERLGGHISARSNND